jgi:MYXO-CTERM domain-containing protein
MDIRVFVLANERAAPTNYQHVLVNPLKIDWLTRAMNYKEVISNAVDADMAGGRAFVTEYAGTSTAVSQFGIHSDLWDDQAFVGLDPVQTVNVLNDQGLANCLGEFDCAWQHPLVFGLLLEFLPPPDGVEPLQFYADLGSFAGDIDAVKWNMGMEFSAALLDRIIEPGLAAVDLLDTWPYLTRMYTTISPAEMMEDPIFHLNPDLEEVTNIRVADNYILCNGDSVVTLPDDREVYVPGAFTWPDIPGELWWEEEVQTIALKGAPMTLVNNTAAITKVLTEWNLTHGWPRVPGEGTGNVPTGDYTSGASEGSSDGPPLEGESGCGCRSQDGVHGLWLLLGLLGLCPRRRRW